KPHRFAFIRAFGQPPPGTILRHRCNNKMCVNPDHLEAGTHLQNMADRKAAGGYAEGEQSPMAKLTEAQVLEIRQLSADGVGSAKIAKRFGVVKMTVRNILLRRTWKHI